jgi:hypothetical protein
MLIANVISLEDHEIAPDVVRYLSVLCNHVCYTAHNSSAGLLAAVRDNDASVANIPQRYVPRNSMIYDVAWENVRRFARPNDWILTIFSNEVLWGITDLLDLMKSTHQVGMATMIDFTGGINFANLYEPRFCRFYEGNGDFWHEKPWPFYVDTLMRRPHLVSSDTGLYIQSLTEIDGEAFDVPSFIDLGV